MIQSIFSLKHSKVCKTSTKCAESILWLKVGVFHTHKKAFFIIHFQKFCLSKYNFFHAINISRGFVKIKRYYFFEIIQKSQNLMQKLSKLN